MTEGLSIYGSVTSNYTYMTAAKYTENYLETFINVRRKTNLSILKYKDVIYYIQRGSHFCVPYGMQE